MLAYNPGTNRARIELGLVGKTANGIADVPLILPAVPVVWPRFAGAIVIGRLDPDDEVLLVVMDRSIDRWLLQGGPVDLESDRNHELTDAIAIPGLSSARNPIATDSSEVTIGREDGSATIYLTLGPAPGTVRVQSTVDVLVEAPSVRLGESALNGAIDGDAGAAAALSAAITALTTIAAAPIPEPPAAGAGAAIDALTAALLALLQTLHVSTKVHVE